MLAAATISACGKDHEHDVSKWTVSVPATCSTEGEEEGICSICMQTVTRTLPIDPDNHVYGEWQDIRIPTETATGRATKICTLNSEHSLRVFLPVLGSSEYETSITTFPTVTENGVRTFTYPHEEGDIVFTTEIQAGGIQAVRDAVEVGSRAESRALVRRAKGTIGAKYYQSGNDVTSGGYYPYMYEFGDDYTHIDDIAADKSERWYGIDADGEIYGYLSDTKSGSSSFEEETANKDDSAGYIYGYRYYMSTSFTNLFYGVENLLSGLYTMAKSNMNGDFAESVNTEGDSTVYHFEFGYYRVVGEKGGFFAFIDVDFTLDENYVIKTLEADSLCYANTAFAAATWELDENGRAHVIAGNETGTRYTEHIDATQTTIAEAEAAGEKVPVNPYNKDLMYITGFDVEYGGNIVGEDEVITLPANGNLTKFTLTNIQPEDLSGASTDQPSEFYYRKYDENGGYTDLVADIYGANGVIVFHSSSDTMSFSVRSKIKGYVDIVVKTQKQERVLHFYFEPTAPTAIYPAVYVYARTGYSLNTVTQSSTAATVYVGQPLYFKATLPTDDGEDKYADESFTAEITSSNAANAVLNADDQKDGISFTSFTAKAAGTYTITLKSGKGSAQAVITVTVNDVPDEDALFGVENTYTGSLNYGGFGKVTVTFGKDANNNTIAVISTETATERLRCQYDAVGHTLTTSHYGGANAGFTLSLNEAYDLVISHSTDFGFDETEILMLRVADAAANA